MRFQDGCPASDMKIKFRILDYLKIDNIPVLNKLFRVYIRSVSEPPTGSKTGSQPIDSACRKMYPSSNTNSKP